MKKKQYSFNKERHHHSLDGKPLFGVTTVLGVIAKPMLIQWSANMAVKHIEDNFPTAEQVMNGFKFSDLFKEAKTAHNKKKTDAGSIGTDAHSVIENYIKNDVVYTGDNEQIYKMFGHFYKWAKKNNVQFIASEQNVWSEVLWIGGIVDFICTINGKRYLGDIKTGSGIYPEHFLQMAAYDLCLQEMGNEPAYGYIVLNLRKDGKFAVKKLVASKKLKDGFTYALGLYKTLKAMKWNAYGSN